MDHPALPSASAASAIWPGARPTGPTPPAPSGARRALGAALLLAPGLWLVPQGWGGASMALSLPFLVGAGLVLARLARQRGASALLCDASISLLAAFPAFQRWRWARLQDFDQTPYIVQDQLFEAMLRQAGPGAAAVGSLLLCAGLGIFLLGVRGVGPRTLTTAGALVLASGGAYAISQRVSPSDSAPLLALASLAWLGPLAVGMHAVWTRRGSPLAALVGATAVLLASQATRSPLSAVAAELPPVVVPGRAALPPATGGFALASAPLVLPDPGLATRLVAAGFPRLRGPLILPLRQAGDAWAQAPRNVVAVAAPAAMAVDELFGYLDQLAAHGVLRALLVGRAPPLPGPFGQAFAWPTVRLLLDAPPNDAGWARLDQNGLRWEVEPLAVGAIQEPVCGLRVDHELSTGALHAALEALELRAGRSAGAPCAEGVSVVITRAP